MTVPNLASLRSASAIQQRLLVDSLVCGENAPGGFDSGRVSAAAASLVRKRMHGVARVWPRLRECIGADYYKLFSEYASAAPLVGEASPLGDGRRFAFWLHGKRALSEDARIEILAFDLRWKMDRRGLVRRSIPSIKIALVGTRVLCAVRFPPLGERWFSFPFFATG